MRIGFIARADNGGLGVESWEFVKHMKPAKVLVIRGEHGHYPERFSGYNCIFTTGIPTHDELSSFLRDIDLVFSIETFYNWGAIPMARERRIKTVLRVNYEMNLNQIDYNLPVADWFIVPSRWNYDNIRFSNKSYLPFPVNREIFSYKNKHRIESFYHVAGHLATEDRNGTQALLESLRFIKSGAPIKIFTQLPIDFDVSKYPNVELEKIDFENYWDVHQGDCLIMPRRYGGQCLSLNESLSLGNPVIMPNIEPQSIFLPAEMLFETNGSHMIMCQGGPINSYNIEPQVLARKIDEMYSMDVSNLSESANKIAETMSWDYLKPKYEQLFEEVINETTQSA